MTRFIYSFLLTLAVPLLLFRLYWRGRRQPAYRQRKGERFARSAAYPHRDAERPLILVHAVSVGEVHAAVPLINRLLAEKPGHQLLLTTTTPTGSARVKELFGEKVLHVYLPWDVPVFIRRFLRYFSPVLLVILETELWPNLLARANASGIPAVLVNARLSEKSAAGYRRFSALSAEMMQHLSLVCAQSDADGERFISLGLNKSKLAIVNSLKFEFPVPEQQVLGGQEYRSRHFKDREIVIAASTREGEEEKVLGAFRALRVHRPDTVLVLVPRHPDRLAEVKDLLDEQKWPYFCRSASSRESDNQSAAVMLGDTMGEMFFYYSLADVAFVGGSLVNTGCQNILEPAALGLPVVTGPSLFNFQSASDELVAAGGQFVVPSAAELALQWQHLLENSDQRKEAGDQARQVFLRKSGASKELLAHFDQLLG